MCIELGEVAGKSIVSWFFAHLVDDGLIFGARYALSPITVQYSTVICDSHRMLLPFVRVLSRHPRFGG